MYCPVSLLDMTDKLLEKILIDRIFSVVTRCRFLPDEQVGIRPKHITSLQLVCLIERVTRMFGDKMLMGVVFLDVAKAFDSIWVDGLLFKLPFPQLALEPSRHHVLLSAQLDVRGVLSNSHVHLSWHAGWHRAGQTNFPCAVVCMSTTCLCHPAMSRWPCMRTTRHCGHVPQASAAFYLLDFLS